MRGTTIVKRFAEDNFFPAHDRYICYRCGKRCRKGSNAFIVSSIKIGKDDTQKARLDWATFCTKCGKIISGVLKCKKVSKSKNK